MASHVGRVLGGRYRLVAPIGAGASSQVFLAEDVTLHRQVAVKLLRPELANDERFLERFQAEARTAASLNHPHVLAVFDWGEDEGPFIVSEYLAGGSLRAMLDEGRTLTPSQALLIGVEATRALEYAHRRGLVHRDIKPANLLFDSEGHLRIADFGLARALAEASVTEPTGVVGTARYVAPEQARGEAIDDKSDVYSLGLVLVEAVSGSLPFDAETTLGTLMARLDHAVELDDSFGALRSPLERAAAEDRFARPDAGSLSVAFMAAAEMLPRPDPLPLAGAVVNPTARADDLRDPTVPQPALVQPVAQEPEPASRRDRRLRAQLDRYQSRIDREEAIAAGTLRRRRWPWVLVAVLLLGGAAAGAFYAWDSSQVESYAVPNLVGTSFDDLGPAVGEFGWEVEKNEARVADTVRGEIVDQAPGAGSSLAEGGLLTVTVSRGEPLVPIPTEILGFHVEEAEARLAGDGLALGEVTERYDEEALEGIVVEVEVLLPEVEPGTAVDLVVSQGPAPRSIPDGLVGVSAQEAVDLLAAERLVGTVTEEFSDDVPVGEVISHDPAAGTEVPADSAVALIVSKGPEPVEVPDVIGLLAPEASQVLRDAGLCVDDTEGPPDTDVLATDPPAGETVPKGTCMRVVTRTSGTEVADN